MTDLVRLTRSPLLFEGRHLWHPQPWDAPTEQQHDYLPKEVFERLTGFIPPASPVVSSWVKAYTTHNEAMEAFFRALHGAVVEVLDQTTIVLSQFIRERDAADKPNS